MNDNHQSNTLSASSKRFLLALLGIACSALGIIGVWVPGVPTTIFLLIALWAFSNSSQRLHAWLLKVPILKHALREAHRFQREGTVDKRAKLVSQGCAWLSFIGVSIVFHNLWLSVVVGLLAVSCSAFMYSVPTSQKLPHARLK